MIRPSQEYRAMTGGRSRQIEDWGFAVAIGLVGLRGVSEIAHEWAAMLTKLEPHAHQFPWAFIGTCLLILLPKYLGRVSGGKVWESIGGGLGRLIGRGRPSAPGEGDGAP